MRRYPIIVIDGPDACGKTFLARKFCEQYGGRYLHLTLRKKMLEHQAVSLHLAAKWSVNHPVVIDRHWISEQIYGGVYRSGSPLGIQASRLDCLFADVLGAVYVITLLGSVKETFMAHAQSTLVRDEMYEPDERAVQVINGYWDLWYGTKFCRYETGHCNFVAPLSTRKTQAMLYNFKTSGSNESDLLGYCGALNLMASARRRHVDSLATTQRMLTKLENSAACVFDLVNKQPLTTRSYPSKI